MRDLACLLRGPLAALASTSALVLTWCPAAHSVARTLFTPTGAADFDHLGESVASAGDVNGDGFADVIVGAPDAGGNFGRAYVYHGGPGADAVAELTLTGAALDDNLGDSVASAGDVNGDGFADLIVGAIGNDAGGSGAGRAYVYYGGPGADAVADLTLTGAAPVDWFGYSVATAGDVNGDGFADVIVGALELLGGAGRAYVYYGGPAADAVADLNLSGAVPDDWFGISVASAGDVNVDGFADLIVGAFANDAGGEDAGRVYVYHGGPGADDVADLILTGVAAFEYFGTSVASADLNGDGFADLIVGAVGSSGEAGRAYVYHGGPGADDVADLTLTGAEAGDLLGYSVASAGDVNGDAFADLIVGAPGSDAAGVDAGRAYVYHGGPGTDDVADVTLTGAAASNGFGGSVASAGDVNGDGLADLIVGATNNSAGGSWAGRAYVFAVYRRQVALGEPGSIATPPSDGPFTIESSAELPSRAAPIAAWPLPYRGGALTVSFDVHGLFDSGTDDALVEVYDLHGRRVKTLASGRFPAGSRSVVWDGRDERGAPVRSGVYFLRAESTGVREQLKVTVVR
jgi:hypothetical protein